MVMRGMLQYIKNEGRHGTERNLCIVGIKHMFTCTVVHGCHSIGVPATGDVL